MNSNEWENGAGADRKMPCSLPSERALLGSVLIDPAVLNELVPILKPDDFYVEEHRAILEAIASHDPDEAERLTELHIAMARENVAGNLGEVNG